MKCLAVMELFVCFIYFSSFVKLKDNLICNFSSENSFESGEQLVLLGASFPVVRALSARLVSMNERVSKKGEKKSQS
jgi:hypothetical protein